MDTDSELGRAKQILFAGILFLVSAYITYEELIYFFRGRESNATVTKVQVVSSRRRFRNVQCLQISYQFTDADGTSRTGSDTTGTDWERTSKVTVQYTPGWDGRSRLAGSVNWWGLLLFGGSVAWLGAAIYKLHREANEPIRRGNSRRI